MKLKYTFIIIYFISFTNTVLNQGYFGKKNFFEITTSINNPSLYNFYTYADYYSTSYKNENGTLVEKNQKINIGFQASIGRVINNNLSLSLEGIFCNFLAIPEFDYGKSSNYLGAEMFKINKRSIVPKIEFSFGDGLLPLGLFHQIGIGFNTYTPIEKEYLAYEYDNNWYLNSSNSVVVNSEYYNYRNDKIKGYTALYRLGMRIPINEFSMFNFGFRYTFNFVPNLDFMSSTSKSDDDYFIAREDMRNMIRIKENRSLLYFESGLTFNL
ncbi:MAG: hypothetical protein ACON4M_08410 [Crocinitomicaceae bacterium]